MRMLTLLAAAIVLGLASPARADTGLTGAVAAAYFPRTPDPGLHAIAHERVAEISACDGCLDHSGMRAGTAEVLGYNAGHPSAVAAIVGSWRSSSVHDGILSNGGYGRIGCAELVRGDEHWFVCVLAAGPLPAPPAPPGPPQPVQGAAPLLPDTAIP